MIATIEWRDGKVLMLDQKKTPPRRILHRVHRLPDRRGGHRASLHRGSAGHRHCCRHGDRPRRSGHQGAQLRRVHGRSFPCHGNDARDAAHGRQHPAGPWKGS
ncbi:MAG: hypothetical protein MZV70_59120 [Desulfobacterales bacterium]|nr:hypothetical protein [Desulfobacterales bacterium]